MQIHVTQEMIDKNGHSCKNCPVQRSIYNLLPDDYHVEVYTQHLNIWTMPFPKGYYSFSIRLPQNVINWIEAYDDRGIYVEPFSFNLSAECFMI